MEETREYVVDLSETPPESLEIVARSADLWGGGWKPAGIGGGRLVLPVLAGLRRGWVGGEVEVEKLGKRKTRLRFRVEESEYHLEKPSVAVLVLAAAGGLVTMVAPFFPALIRFVPIAVLLAFGAWFFIVARLRNSGPEEFFEELGKAGEPAGEPGDESPG